jgi:hypothetical protein
MRVLNKKLIGIGVNSSQFFLVVHVIGLILLINQALMQYLPDLRLNPVVIFVQT